MYVPDYPERTFQDIQRWSGGLIGKIFYQLDPSNPKRFRTIRLAWNGFASKIVPQYSNFVEGTPPEELKPVNPRLLSSLATMQPNTPEFH